MSQFVRATTMPQLLSSYTGNDRHPYVRPRHGNRSFHLLVAMVTILALVPVLVAMLASSILV